MLPIVFLILFVACLALWLAGAAAWLVFALALTAWVVFALAAYPKIRTYKAAMGIDDELIARETKGWRWLVLRLAGLKVLIVGFTASMVPFVGAAADWMASQKLDFFFDPNDPRAQQRVMFVIGAVAFAAPMLMAHLHLGAIKDAAVAEPKG